jgi:hypothetical protein
MTTAKKLISAAGAAGAGEVTYVDDVFSTYLYDGNGDGQGIPNGINLGDFGVGTSTKFDGTSDYLSRSSDLTGNADGKTLTFSCWVFLGPLVAGTSQRVMYTTDSSDNGIAINISDTGVVGIEAGAGGSWSMQASTTSLPIGLNVWTHILISFDLTNSSNRYIYINDVAASVSWNLYGNSNIDFTRSTHYIGAWGNGTRKINDNMAHFYLDYTYRDLSTESNRRIFIDANGGSTSASSLTALNPIMYLPMTTAYAVGKNAGTGGDFTSNGTPTIVENGTEYVADSGKGGLVWIKDRGNESHHIWTDTVRGNTKTLWSGGDGNYQERTETTYVMGFTSSGFTVGTGGEVNSNTNEHVSWTFRKQPGFFDIVTYTGNSTSGRSIAHSLGSVPGSIWVKNLTDNENWVCYHRGLEGTHKTAAQRFVQLNQTGAAYPTDTSVSSAAGTWAGTAPNADNFFLGNGVNENGSGKNYVAYLFAHDAQEFGTDSDESIIKCGSYTGNGGDLSINLGFEPQWVMVKPASASGNWEVFDNMRGITNSSSYTLRPNSSQIEADYAGGSLTLSANGFNVNVDFGVNGREYIYMAIRRPHKPASEFAATDLFMQDNDTRTTGPKYISGFPVDFALQNTADETGYTQFSSRITGKQMYTSDSQGEEGSPEYDYSTGFKESGGSTNADDYGWMWRRAPGFTDVVAYTGNGTARAITHNLGVVPEMMIVKNRSGTGNWNTYHSTLGATKYLSVDDTAAVATNSARWNDTAPTSTQFTVGSYYMVNQNNSNIIAYLFASVDGISKVGSYTGTGNDLNVDCGFSAGARLVIIRRTDSTGDWYFYDSLRGIVAGNDPYLLLNSTAAHVTNTDYIDPLASGFTVTSSAPAALNNNGGTYIFYAIA